jgi:uncharacterized protein (TIGR04141 family)
MAKAQKQRLTWFLIKRGSAYASVDQIIEPPESGQLHRYKVSALNTQRESLFVKSSAPVPPKWVGYVSGHITAGALPKVLGASSAGVLLVPAGKDLFAVTFGYGRFLLKPGALVQDFGLKVVLNSVDPRQIKSVDARTFDELTVHTRRGVSRDSSFSAFELDVTRDLLRGITGHAADGKGMLSGSVSLSLNSEAELPALPAMAKELAGAYRAKRYKKHFDFIDHMQAERDPRVVEKLDAKLLEALKAEEMTEMHLAIPEAVDWQQIAGVRFSYRKKGQAKTPDPRISAYRALRKAEDLDFKRLQTDKVEAISSVDENQLHGHWRVYDCLVFETEYDGYLYVLSGGDWYRISKTYRDRVDERVGKLSKLRVGLPPASVEETEAEYNHRAAKAIDGLCLDGKTIGVGGVDRVELCDVLKKDGVFIHVKKRGRSSTLSHLFAQGVTAADLLLNDEEFRKDAVALATAENKNFAKAVPASLGERESIKVAYVILSRSKRKDRPFGLPFFSLVSLQAAARTLRNAGITVYVQEIKEQ